MQRAKNQNGILLNYCIFFKIRDTLMCLPKWNICTLSFAGHTHLLETWFDSNTEWVFPQNSFLLF